MLSNQNKERIMNKQKINNLISELQKELKHESDSIRILNQDVVVRDGSIDKDALVQVLNKNMTTSVSIDSSYSAYSAHSGSFGHEYAKCCINSNGSLLLIVNLEIDDLIVEAINNLDVTVASNGIVLEVLDTDHSNYTDIEVEICPNSLLRLCDHEENLEVRCGNKKFKVEDVYRDGEKFVVELGGEVIDTQEIKKAAKDMLTALKQINLDNAYDLKK